MAADGVARNLNRPRIDVIRRHRLERKLHASRLHIRDDAIRYIEKVRLQKTRKQARPQAMGCGRHGPVDIAAGLSDLIDIIPHCLVARVLLRQAANSYLTICPGVMKALAEGCRKLRSFVSLGLARIVLREEIKHFNASHFPRPAIQRPRPLREPRRATARFRFASPAWIAASRRPCWQREMLTRSCLTDQEQAATDCRTATQHKRRPAWRCHRQSARNTCRRQRSPACPQTGRSRT